MRLIATAAALLIATTSLTFAQTEQPVDAQTLRSEITQLRGLIAVSQANVNDMTEELLATDKQIEDTVDQIVSYLASVKDSTDSGTRVLNVKTRAMQGLEKAARNYARERDKLQDTLRRTSDPDAVEDKTKTVEALTERTEKRVDQIVELTSTLATDYDFERYTRDFTTGWQRSETPEYKWNKKSQMAAKPAVNQVDKALEQSKENLERQNLTLNAQKQGQRKVDQPKFDAQIERNEAIIEKRKQQLNEVEVGGGSSYGQGSEALTKSQAQNLDAKLREMSSGINTDFNNLMRLNNELQVERSRLRQLQRAERVRVQAWEQLEGTSYPADNQEPAPVKSDAL